MEIKELIKKCEISLASDKKHLQVNQEKATPYMYLIIVHQGAIRDYLLKELNND